MVAVCGKPSSDTLWKDWGSSSIYRFRNWCPGRFSNLPKVTQSMSGEAEVCSLASPCSPLPIVWKTCSGEPATLNNSPSQTFPWSLLWRVKEKYFSTSKIRVLQTGRSSVLARVMGLQLQGHLLKQGCLLHSCLANNLISQKATSGTSRIHQILIN